MSTPLPEKKRQIAVYFDLIFVQKHSSLFFLGYFENRLRGVFLVKPINQINSMFNTPLTEI